MLFNKIILTTALASFTGFAHAAQLRANVPDEDSARVLTERVEEIYDDGYLFFLESKAYDDNYLGYNKDADKRAWLKPEKVKFAYDKYWRLEKHDDESGKTGKCYEMNDKFEVYLKDCSLTKTEQKWLVSKAPEYYGDYYTISNAHYGYALEYDADYGEYYLNTRSWKNVDYDDKNDIYKILFYKEASYVKYTDDACRTSSGGVGLDDGKDYVKVEKSRDDCRKTCSQDQKCKGWEYSQSSSGVPRCEIWYTEPEKVEHKNGFDCYVKEH